MAWVKIPDEGLKVYQLKIAINDTKPLVWRRVLVSNLDSLTDLHFTIQGVFDWMNSHMFEFQVGLERLTTPMMMEAMEADRDMGNADSTRLQQVLSEPKSKIRYIYDFGDYWVHSVTLEKELEPVPGEKYPQVIAGKNGAPPEDCGGPWGYGRLVDITERGPQTEDEEDLLNWVGKKLMPHEFNLAKCARRLAKYCRPRILVRAPRAKKSDKP